MKNIKSLTDDNMARREQPLAEGSENRSKREKHKWLEPIKESQAIAQSQCFVLLYYHNYWSDYYLQLINIKLLSQSS